MRVNKVIAIIRGMPFLVHIGDDSVSHLVLFFFCCRCNIYRCCRWQRLCASQWYYQCS